MSILPAEEAFFKLLATNKADIDSTRPILPQMRDIINKTFTEHLGQNPNIVFTDINVRMRDNKLINARIFNPNTQGPTIFFLPGNAFLFDIFRANSAAAARIASFSRCKVVIINYRLMPESAWPTPINDIEDTINYMCKSNNEFDIDPKLIFLSGICSGALAAMLVTLRANLHIKIMQLLIVNGLYDQSLEQNAYAAYEAKDGMVNRKSLEWGFDYYNFSKSQAKHPAYSPLYANDFSMLPDTRIFVGEYDGFRSDSEALFLKLKQNHVEVTKEIFPGQTHNTLLLRSAMSDGIDPAERITQAVLEKLSQQI